MNSERRNRKILCDIAHCSFDVVGKLLARDQEFARDLRGHDTLSRQVYREESITTELAITLQEEFPKHVQTEMLTPRQEKESGADWYWRIESGDRAIHARVQAKRVQRSQFGQPDGSGHVDIDVSQLSRLSRATSYARRQIPGLQAWLATYARFSATPPCGYDDLLQCTYHTHEEDCAGHQPSLWIAHAEEIGNLNQRKMPVSRIVTMSLRMDCLLPCSDRPRPGSGPLSKGFELAEGLLAYRECLAVIEEDPDLRPSFQGALRIFL